MPFRFIHSADLHLGHPFETLPEPVRGRLSEARHQSIASLAQAARNHETSHILIAGDIFDTETPTEPVWRQALAAMTADSALQWWLLPGAHDSLAAERLWARFRSLAAANVHLIDDVAPIEIDPGTFLLPAPLPRRTPDRDLTVWMLGCPTDPRSFRIGLAHGAVHDLSDAGDAPEGVIPSDRARAARLDYLALGGWHGQLRVGARTHYAGTPERDGFQHDGRGTCLAVTLDAPGAVPVVHVVPTGRFVWADEVLPLSPGQPAEEALFALLPTANRREHLFRIRASGSATLAEQAALHSAAATVAPEFCHFVLDTADLATAPALPPSDQQPAVDRAPSQRTASPALNRLYGHLRKDCT